VKDVFIIFIWKLFESEQLTKGMIYLVKTLSGKYFIAHVQ